MRANWYALALAAGYAVFAVGAAGAIETKTEQDLFGFRDAIFGRESGGLVMTSPTIRCEQPLANYGYDTPESFYFIGDAGEGVALWVLAGFPFSNISELWKGQAFSRDLTLPPTAEWGWVYDRNADGRIDWMAYVESTVYLVPETGVPADEAAAAAIQDENVRLTFIHTVDSDFDGTADAFIGVPTARESGWSEGAMLVARDPNGVTKCHWKSDYGGDGETDCTFTDGLYTSVEPGPVRARSMPMDGLTDFFDLLTHAADACGFGFDDIAARP